MATRSSTLFDAGTEAAPRSMAGIFRVAALTALAAAIAAQILPIASVFPNGIMDDDAYFYSQIAYNIGALGVPTFDGITTASGFHLMWGWLLGAASWLLMPLTDAKPAHLFMYLFVSVSLAILIARHAAPRMPERVCAFVLFFLASLVMETVLLSGLFLFVFIRLLDEERPIGAAWYDYAALFCIPLTRIDATVVPGLLLLLMLFRSPRTAIALGTALAAGIVTHFAAMYALFGEFYSVSSLLKATRAGNFARENSFIVLNLTASKAQMVRVAATAVLFTLAALNILRTPDRGRQRLKLGILAGIAVFFAVPFCLVIMRSWYFLPTHIALLWLATRPDTDLRWRESAAKAAGAFAVALIFVYAAGVSAYHMNNRADQANNAAFAKEIRRLVPENGRIYQIDGVGYVGFFAGRPVINGDGLMNDYSYARRVAAGTLDGYLDEMGVCYVITNRRGEFDAPMLVDHFGLAIPKSEAKLLYRVPQDGRNRFSDFALWRLDAPRCN